MKIFLELNIPKSVTNPDRFIDYIVKRVSAADPSFYGFFSKDILKKNLKVLIFDPNIKESLILKNIEEKKIFKILDYTGKRCFAIRPSSQIIYVKILPTFCHFVHSKMDNVSGATVNKNKIMIFIYKNIINERALKYGLAHEYAHSISYNYYKPNTLIKTLVIEGVAELFAETATGQTSKFSHRFKAEELKKILDQIKYYLSSPSKKIKHELFNMGKKYPLWAGYSLGYKMVKNYVKKNGTDWSVLFKTNPTAIVNDYINRN